MPGLFLPDDRDVEQPTPTAKDDAAAIELTAVVVAVTAEEPRVLTIEDANALPSGPFTSSHRTLHMGLRSWVEQQTHHPLGYVEQLYTFADRDRRLGEGGGRSISICYLGLTREAPAPEGQEGGRWRNWYHYFPWEDWRAGTPQPLPAILRRLRQWAK